LKIHKLKHVKNVVFECPGSTDRAAMQKAIKSGKNVYVLEPFCAYHHRRFRFFPSPLPEYVQTLLKDGRIEKIDADKMDSRTISFAAAEKAVQAIEDVFPYYLKDHKTLIEFIANVHHSQKALNIFKKNLCDMLGDFFSLNTMFHKIENMFKGEKVLIYPDTDIKNYLYLKKIVNDSAQDAYKHNNILFSKNRNFYYFKDLFVKSIAIKGGLFVQTLASLLFGYIFSKPGKSPVKDYPYAISIVAPKRQLRNNSRGPGFLIDNKKITADQVVYTPIVPIDNSQLKILNSYGSNVFEPPKIGRFFSDWKKWFFLWLLSFKGKYLLNDNELKIAAFAMFTYFKWQYVLKYISFSNFITHCDFSTAHISRNILFKQNNIQTWYFTDAVNFGHAFRESDDQWNRHPFWTYLYYDHFVTWYDDLADYFAGHPQTFKQSHVVGCLWSSHVDSGKDNADYMKSLFKDAKSKESFIVAVYPSTYTVKGITSYEEGVCFIEDVYRLVNEIDNVFIVIKEKKEMALHMQLEPVLGQKLTDLYTEMEKHPRIKILTNEFDSSLLMANADMCISFPFTSTTTEALSANLKSIWHDPGEQYRNTPYGQNTKSVTFGYKELKAKVMEIKDMPSDTYKTPIPLDSNLLDPFRDGKAVDRFRDLLVSGNDGNWAIRN
jgi:polysaccharide biosynthesis PFTS motif protein